MAATNTLIKLSGDHTIDESLLPEAPIVLDVGARGFGFCRDILAIRPDARVIALEPDPEVDDPQIQGISFHRVALVHDSRHTSLYASFSTGEANFLTDNVPGYAKSNRVDCINITELMDVLRITHWDAVKLDCEGSEFGILENWPGPIATQISIEFHDFQSRARYHDAYFDRLFNGALRDYRVIQHELTPVGPDNTMGHWDSLLVLRGNG